MRFPNRVVRVCAVTAAAIAALAVFTSSAIGYAWTVEWTGAVETGESEAVSLKLKKESTTKLSGTVSALEVELSATGLEGVETKLEANGALSGKMKFSGLKLAKPVGCAPPASLTTAALKGEMVKVGSTLYEKIVPASGTTLATITLTGTCALAGTPFKLTGNLYAQLEPLETKLTEQPLEFSPVIQTAAGGKFEMGGNPATLTEAARGVLTSLHKFWTVLIGPRYKMETYGEPLGGTSTSGQVFEFGGKEIVCPESNFSSSLAAAATKLRITPTYAECNLIEAVEKPVTFQQHGCVLEAQKPVLDGANYKALAKIVCEAGKSMVFEVFGGPGKQCEVSIGSQTSPDLLELSNFGTIERDVKFTADLDLNVQVTENKITCPLMSGAFTADYKAGTFELDAPRFNEFFVE